MGKSSDGTASVRWSATIGAAFFHFASSGAKFSEDTYDEIERFKEAKLSNPYTIVDFDKKENIPVELVKDMMRTLSRKPLRGQRRVAAVLDIDKMAFGAADLFLKTVEEPPADTHVILTTSRPEKPSTRRIAWPATPPTEAGRS